MELTPHEAFSQVLEALRLKHPYIADSFVDAVVLEFSKELVSIQFTSLSALSQGAFGVRAIEVLKRYLAAYFRRTINVPFRVSLVLDFP